jgi:CRISPR-associated protein Cas1
MLRKTIDVATPGTRLSIAHRQLVIERPDLPKTTLPIEDIGVVIVDDRRAIYTRAVFIELLGVGATLMVSGRDHLPALQQHHRGNPQSPGEGRSRSGAQAGRMDAHQS